MPDAAPSLHPLQSVVEKMLASEGKPSRVEMGREAFTERVWAWKAEYGGSINNQLRRLGASCDWERERFTLDEGLSSGCGGLAWCVPPAWFRCMLSMEGGSASNQLGVACK